MLEAMQNLALDFLYQKLGGDSSITDIHRWYLELRKNRPQDLFPFLVEDTGKIEKVFILETEANSNKLLLNVEDVAAAENSKHLPFVRPSGSQAAQVGPIFKRSYSKNGASPSAKIIKTTMEQFNCLANSQEPWSEYFKEILEILNLETLVLHSREEINWKKEGFEYALQAAIKKIDYNNNTVFLAVRDKQGKLPGARPEYLDYLMNKVLAGSRYKTGEAEAQLHARCPLCGNNDVTVYPNALKGAGINISNADRPGVFSNIKTTNAWKKFALCASCADLLFIYKFHVLKPESSNGKKRFITRIAGDNAIILPHTTADLESRKEMMDELDTYVKNIREGENIEENEEDLLCILKNEKALLSLTFIWATVGQNIEDVSGFINNVLPSRLKELSKINEAAKEELYKEEKHRLFPTVVISRKKFNLLPDLSLSALDTLFHRPGRDAKAANSSKKLKELKRSLAASIFYKQLIPKKRFWEEIMITARYRWMQAVNKRSAYELLHEGESDYPTTCNWVRHLAWWIFYFKKFVEVMSMESSFYEPLMPELKPYFGPESGIDSAAKAYAFLLGVLYGKVLEVQGARKVNVGSNALTWLKGLSLRARDLPRLYIKIRKKLLAYETEKNAKVRMLLSELGQLGVKLGDAIELDEVQTNYYLLLGQSLTTTILKKE